MAPLLSTVDTRTAALYRVGIAMALIAELLSAWPDACTMYGADGVAPRAFPLLPLHWESCSLTMRAHTVHLIAAVLLLVGLFSRTSAVIAYALQLSLLYRNPDVQTTDAAVLCACLLWAALLPVGALWSVDSIIGTPHMKTQHVSLAVSGLKVHLVLFYTTSVVFKVTQGRHPLRFAPDDAAGRGSSPWLDGSAVAEALLCCEYQRPLGARMAQLPVICACGTYLTLVLEALAPPALLLFDGESRLVPLLLLWSLHAFMHACLALGHFSLICVAALSIFIPAEAWNSLEVLSSIWQTGSPAVGVDDGRAPRRRAGTWGDCIIGVAASTLAGLVVCVSIDSLTDQVVTRPYTALARVAAVGRALGLPARFDMFAPPPNECGWLVVPATIDPTGTRVDALKLLRLRGHHAGSPLGHSLSPAVLAASRVTYQPPHFPASQYSLLWHRLIEQLSDQHSEQSDEARGLRDGVGAYLCRQLPEVRRLEMVFVAEVYAFGTIAPRFVGRERRQIWMGSCPSHVVQDGMAKDDNNNDPAEEIKAPIAVATEGASPALELFRSRISLDTWRDLDLNVLQGSSGKPSHLSTADGEIVMATDEEPYMRALVHALISAGGTGRVLEIGFGLGLSARHLAASGVLQHLIIEPNRGVFNTSITHAEAVSQRTAVTVDRAVEGNGERVPRCRRLIVRLLLAVCTSRGTARALVVDAASV